MRVEGEGAVEAQAFDQGEAGAVDQTEPLIRPLGRDPARFLGMEHELGTLERGALAAVITVKGDALAEVGLLKEVDVV